MFSFSLQRIMLTNRLISLKYVYPLNYRIPNKIIITRDTNVINIKPSKVSMIPFHERYETIDFVPDKRQFSLNKV